MKVDYWTVQTDENGDASFERFDDREDAFEHAHVDVGNAPLTKVGVYGLIAEIRATVQTHVVDPDDPDLTADDV